MSAIRQAIQNLEAAIGRLEQGLSEAELNLQGQQRDMFSMPSAPAAPPLSDSPSGQPIDNVALMSEKIDSAIDKVEALLRGAQ